RLYQINDSGDIGQFYITAPDGSDTRAVRIAGFDPKDNEAMSLGTCTQATPISCIYVGDIGDNDARRSSIEIVLVEEVRRFSDVVKPRNRLKLRYPDRPHDAESMAVH